MAKKIKNKFEKLKAQNSQETQLLRNSLLLKALNYADYEEAPSGFNPSLTSLNGYSNLGELLSLQYYLLTNLYKTYGILGKIVDVPVDDAYKNGGFELEADTLDDNDLNELNNKRTKENDTETVKNAHRWARLYGGGAVVALTAESLSAPLDVQRLYGRQLKFVAVNRWQLNYSLGNINIPNGRWYLTQNAALNNSGTEIHPSRVFILKGKEAPFLIQQQLGGWGMSVYEQIFQDINILFKARNALFEALDEAKIDILKLATLQTAMTTGGGEAELKRMINYLARAKNNRGMLTISTSDEYDQKQISFAGMDGVSKEIRIMIAGASDIPVNKLWGEGVTGFGSGEDSLENYNSMIDTQIRTPDNQLIAWMLTLRSYQIFGREVEDLTPHWKNLRVLSAIDEQNIKDHVLTNVLQLFDRQLLSPKETMEYLRKKEIFIHETRALKGELEDEPLTNNGSELTELRDIIRE